MAWMSRKTGKSYRLLSEAERDYVTRASRTTACWWGSSITPAEANYNGNGEPYKGGGSKGEYRRHTVPVDCFQPNPWGLYNVHGNVWEGTEDCWYDSNRGAFSDGSARLMGDCTRRVLRGGFWSLDPTSALPTAARILPSVGGTTSAPGWPNATSLIVTSSCLEYSSTHFDRTRTIVRARLPRGPASLELIALPDATSRTRLWRPEHA